MGILEDPITGDYPSRTAALEEDEAAAEALADQYAVKPTIQWAGGAEPVETLVLLLGRAAHLLAATLFAATPAGTVAVPELQRLRSPLEEEYGRGAAHIHTSSLGLAPSGTAVVSSPRELPAEQAAAWAAAVLQALRPAAVVIATTMMASEYRGPNTSADEDLVFCLRTSSAQPPAGVPQLPSGTVVGGVAAAALQRCELTGVPAVAVIAVEGAPVPDAGLVCSLAAALCKALPSAAARQGVRGGGALHAEVAAAVDSLYRSSASESMFI